MARFVGTDPGSAARSGRNGLGRNKTARRLFPLVATLFIFILVANWFSLFPGVGTFGYAERTLTTPKSGTTVPALAVNSYALTSNTTIAYSAPNNTSSKVGSIESDASVKITELQNGWAKVVTVQERAANGEDIPAIYNPIPATSKNAITGYVQANSLLQTVTQKSYVPIVRAPNADLNMTLAMALIAVITANVLAILSHGVLGWLKEFFPKPYAMDPLLTPIEIITQFARIFSLTFRLFGNVFAGEVLFAVIMYIAGPILVVFVGLELAFGLIQALVFAALTSAYMTLAFVGTHGGESHDKADDHHEEADATNTHDVQPIAS